MEVFAAFASALESETERREKIRQAVKKLDAPHRLMTSVLATIHSPQANYNYVCEQLTTQLTSGRSLFAELALLVPAIEYYKYNDMFKFTMQQYIFLLGMKVFLSEGRLFTYKDIGECLQIEAENLNVFHYDVEDYLHAICSMSPELSRLAINCVIRGDYELPLKIAEFLNMLLSLFQLLNLKNDALRKRYDGIKYDVKKTEEVVYDIRVRKLAPTMSS